MTDPTDLRFSQIQHIADPLSKQPPEVRDLFRYALVLTMIDDEKARIDGMRIEIDREYLVVQTIAGDVFEIK